MLNYVAALVPCSHELVSINSVAATTPSETHDVKCIFDNVGLRQGSGHRGRDKNSHDGK